MACLVYFILCIVTSVILTYNFFEHKCPPTLAPFWSALNEPGARPQIARFVWCGAKVRCTLMRAKQGISSPLEKRGSWFTCESPLLCFTYSVNADQDSFKAGQTASEDINTGW